MSLYFADRGQQDPIVCHTGGVAVAECQNSLATPMCSVATGLLIAHSGHGDCDSPTGRGRAHHERVCS